MTPTFYVCEEHESSRGRMPCIFTAFSMHALWKRSGGDITRCIRHGKLIGSEIKADSKRDLQKKFRADILKARGQ